MGAAVRRHSVQCPGHGGIWRGLGGVRTYSWLTNTIPLHVEILYNEYQFTAAFAVASLLCLLALVTLIAKHAVERQMGPPATSSTRELTGDGRHEHRAAGHYKNLR